MLLGFFPFLIVSVSLSRIFFSRQTTVAAIDFALRDYFPDALGSFLSNNLPARPVTDWIAILLLLFSSNGIFEPLEVALNKIWGIQKNRSYLHNQVVSLALMFSCGSLALLSLGITELRVGSASGLRIERWTSVLFFKLAAVPLTSLMLFLIYRYLPNGRPPLRRVIAAAIGTGLLLEALKYLNVLVWPWLDARIQREYGVFRYSATILFLSFLASMLVLAGAEWAARGHRLGDVKPASETMGDPRGMLAVITGASSGLGAAFARKLAARGYDLLLIARREDRLQSIAREIGEQYHVRTEILVADLTDDAALAVVAARIRDAPDLGLLVNNAGFGTLGYFFDADPHVQEQMHRLHVLATMRLSHAALANLVPRATAGTGIINVSSVAAFAASPQNVSYGATKTWMNRFTEGLAIELG